MKVLNLKESLEALRKYDLPVAKTVFASSREEALDAAKEVGFPLVVKPNVSEHKTEIGVFLHVKSESELLEAFEKLKPFGEVAIQEELSGLEIFLGAKRDEFFGSYVALGTGGVFVELFEDVSFRLVPLKERDVEEMIEETKLSKFVEGFRGTKLDKGALVDVVTKFSEFVRNEKVVEADVNPLIASEKGVFVVDARVIV